MRAPADPSIHIRIITHNIRYATKHPFEGEEPWHLRKQRLVNELRFHTRYNLGAFICLQEALHQQLVDVMSGLNHLVTDEYKWAYIGQGRDDGRTAGEYSPILYRPAIWDLRGAETIWLSETPDRPSKGWDAGLPRILTTGHFYDRKSCSGFVVMNTHLDDQGSKARLESAKLIISRIKSLSSFPRIAPGSESHSWPVALSGDFNSEPSEDAYQLLNGPESPVQDLRDLVAPEEWYGQCLTYTGFGHGEEPEKRIDFLFVGPKAYQGLNVESYAVLENRFEDGVYISDHRAVVGDIALAAGG